MPKHTNPDGPVYPTDIYDGDRDQRINQVPGVTIRQEFAKSFMAAMLSNPELKGFDHHILAHNAVSCADRLIIALNGQK